MTPHGIDHLVIALGDLEEGREAFARLGFQVTPTARHPFGTANAVVQFDNAYVELLGIADRDRISEPSESAFSFAAFNRDFLDGGQGISMLARKSNDAEADRSAFAERGLPVFDAFDFERMAEGPDGVMRKVAFSLAFTRHERLPRAGFFTCHHHYPKNFWRQEYRAHKNGAKVLASAVLVAPDPADFHEFLTLFTGQHAIRSTSLGIEFDLGDSRIEVASPVAFSAFFGEDPQDRLYQFAGCRIAVPDLDATARFLEGEALPVREIAGSLVVPSHDAHGVAIAFVPSTPPSDD